MVEAFLLAFGHYWQEVWWVLLIGFLMSGVVYVMIPTRKIEKYLGGKGIRPILLASIVGVILPVCCVGSLPLALTLKRKGADLGAVLAFLVATPATSIPALLMCWTLLGPVFTFAIFITALGTAIILGIICGGIDSPDCVIQKDSVPCCSTQVSTLDNEDFNSKFKRILRYALLTLPRQVGLEVILGLALAAFITIYSPLQNWIAEYVQGLFGYGIILVFGLVSYVCSTASVPLADALVQTGVSQGQALCYLLAGPVTSYATILVVAKDFGRHVLIVYLTIIAAVSVFSGIIFDIFIFKTM